MNQAFRKRRGVTIVLAMLYLILFSTLALGFYATTITSIEIAGNDHRGARALMAAESGMDFMRVVMSNLSVSPGLTGAPLLTATKNSLSSQLESTGNLAGQTLTYNGSSLITIPSIALDSDSSFGAAVQLDDTGTQLVVTTTGNAGTSAIASRGISMQFQPQSTGVPMLAYGFVTGGQLTISGSSKILGGGGNPANGSILTTYTGATNVITMSGNTQIDGDISMVHATGNVQTSGSPSIAGYGSPATWASHLHTGVTAPAFPTVDTSAFLPYATGTVLTGNPPGGNTTFNNGILIKANTNPTFTGNKTINGVIYIETPNNVSFSGNTTLKGCIVVQNNPTGTLTQNKLTFTGSVSATGPETLPESYGALRSMTGSFILAPKFDVKFTGNSNTVGGTILCEKLTLTGNGGGTVNGSVIVTGSSATTMSGSSQFIVNPPGGSAAPAGMSGNQKFQPQTSTYTEN